MIDIKTRCPIDPNAIPALHAGDLNKMFARIVDSAPGNQTTEATIDDKGDTVIELSSTQNYTVHVLSQPGDKLKPDDGVDVDRFLPPWVVIFENFVTDEECDTMIKLGHKHKYKRSEDVGDEKFDGTFGGVKSESRTSENAWCSYHDGCRSEDVPTRLHDRISHVLNIPANNSEDFQILKYEVGQYYREHHDYIDNQGMYCS